MIDIEIIVLSTVTVATAFALCLSLVVLSQSRWKFLIRNGDLKAVQTAHSKPASRLGGVAVITAFVAGAGLTYGHSGPLLLALLLSATPLFLSGAAEDLGYNVSPIGRLGAALLSCALAVLLTKSWIDGTGVGVLNPLFDWVPFAVLVTIFGTAAVSHAFNLIDGLNGLSGIMSLIVNAGIGATAVIVDDHEIAIFCTLLASASLGFLLINFPSGKIFLGDAGAYTLGFLLAWLGVVLASRNEDVTPIAMFLILFWPLADIIMSIYRRYLKKQPVLHPDKLHFHQIVMRGLEIGILGRRRRSIANPMAAVLMIPAISAPAVLGVIFHASPGAAAFSMFLLFVAFVVSYNIGVRFLSKIRKGKKMATATSAISYRS